MADQKATKKPEAAKEEKEVKEKKPVVAGKITCTKCKAVKGASRDRYLKLLAKEKGIDYKSGGSNQKERDEATIKALGGIDSVEYKKIEAEVKKKYLCRVCRPKSAKKPKKTIPVTNGDEEEEDKE